MSGVIVELGRLPDGFEAELRGALTRLSRGPGLTARLAEIVGGALGGVGRLIGGRLARWAVPGALRVAPGLQGWLAEVAQGALGRAFEVAVVGLPAGGARTEGRGARLLVAASGAAGGAAGLAGFVPDAVVTTVAIMRRIARIAREEGEDLGQEDGRRACLEVFGLRSGSGAAGVGSESGYFPTRLLLQGGPLVRLLADVGSRYGVQLGQKLAAQAVPIAGAVCGAAINSAFMAEYEGLARAHFVVRRLERVHGAARVRHAAATMGFPEAFRARKTELRRTHS